MNLTGQQPYQRQLKRKKKTNSNVPYKADWDKKRALGCIICGSPAQIHHIQVKAGQRKDHSKTIPLCFSHHLSPEAGLHGMGRKAWEAIYGTEAQLLEKVEKLLAALP